MSYTNGLDKPSDYFNTVLYTGNGTARNITTGLTTTDWVWIKRRDGTANHRLTDVVRGATNMLSSNNTNATQTHAQTVTAFGTNTFSLGTDSGSYDVNTNSQTYASWNWSAGGSASSNTDGSITSTVSANTTAGFSIVSYTGNETVSTIGHGLGVTPSMIIVKGRIAARNWIVGHHTQGWTKSAMLDETNAFSSQTHWNNTAPTSSVFTIEGGSNSNVNTNNAGYIAYCFAEKKGYSKFGSYTGNGNADGTFVYTGFKPAFFLCKDTDNSNDWVMFDNKRDSHNVVAEYLRPNLSNSANSGTNYMDFTSSGIKHRVNDTWNNGSGRNYIFMAFASNPFVTSTGIPTTAR